ncbi:MAG: hypothetical protein JXB49_08765 [Bacteroidales bacterium]|nr:hypothetical protein [Bacteroidales bacterium]
MNSIRLPKTISAEKDKPQKSFQFITAYIIHDPCVITDNQILKVNGKYDLVDFLEDTKIHWVEVRFVNATKISNTLTITVMHLKTKEIIQRSKQIDKDVCDWVITNIFPPDEEVVNDYCSNG